MYKRQEPVRVLEKPPYEVTVTGWGEFEIGVTVHFASDAGEKPLELSAPLKLYLEDTEKGKAESKAAKKPVVKEKYEEIVFHEPREEFAKRIEGHKPKKAPETEITPVLGKRDDRDELLKIATARKVVAERIGVVKQPVSYTHLTLPTKA